MSQRNVYVNNKPLKEAKELWFAALEEHGFFSHNTSHEIPVDNSLGRLTAEPVIAKRSSPSYNAAAMDGIAIHFNDLAGATEASPIRLTDVKYTPVNTGNAIPEGYNAVVMIEDVHQVAPNDWGPLRHRPYV